MKSTTITIRIEEETKNKLEYLAKATKRTKSFIAAEAIREYLSGNEWQTIEIEKAVGKADSGNAKFYPNEEVVDWLESWGTEQEKDI